MRNGRRTPKLRACRGATDERGFAVPTVMFMLLAAFAVVSVGVFASIEAQSGTVRDQDTKTALSVAEAGVSQAMLTYNGGFTTSTSAPCLMPVSDPVNTFQPRTTQNSGSDSWCAPISGANGQGAFSYQVCPSTASHPCAGSGTIEIVSTGTFNGVSRRVDVIAKSASGQQVFLKAGVQSQTDLIIDQNASVLSNAAVGGSISLGATSNSAKLCGQSTVGPGGTLTGSGQYYAGSDCTDPIDPTTVGHQDLTLPPVNQGSAVTVNDNCRISVAAGIPDSSPNCTSARDLISGSASNVSWNPSTRALAITGNKTTLTLTGHTYSFCRLTLDSNSALFIAPGQQVNIFFDRPEDCGPLPAYNPSSPSSQKATAQLWMESSTRISTDGDPSQLNVGLYFVGSESIPTGILMSSNSAATCVQNFVLYAPLSQVEMNSNSHYCGVMAAQSIHMDQNATFTTNTASQQVVIPGTAPHYVTSRFVDCTPTSGSPPDSGC